MYDLFIWIMLAICVGGFGYGMFHHSRFIDAGGQKGAVIAPVSEQSAAARTSFRAMLVGYGVFIVGIIVMMGASAIWGPSGI